MIEDCLITACEILANPEWTEVGEYATCYFPAIEEVKSILQANRSSMTLEDLYYEPAIFFLSDGETSETGIDTAIKELVEKYSATLSTCLFGDDNSQAEQMLRGMSESGSGKFYRASSGRDLENHLYHFRAFLYKTRTIHGYNT